MKRKPIIAKWVLLAGMCALFMFASADSAQAIVRYVDGSRPSSGTGLSWAEAFKTIQEAVDAAAANDEIWIKQGVYSLASPIAVSKPVLLFGGFNGTELNRSQRDWGSNVTTIDGQGTAGCFTATSDVTFDGLSINNGKPGITIPSSVTTAIYPVIANCKFSGNTASEGSALRIISYRSTLQITNTRFENNTANDRGGAIYNNAAEINIQQCQFVNNRVQPDGNINNGGGAIYNDGTICNITDSLFSSNHSGGSQGGAIANSRATGVIANCTFIGNQGGMNGGGAIFNSSSTVTITTCEFISNTSSWGGGAINNSESAAVIQNCTFTDNHSDYVGGAIWNWVGLNPPDVPPKILNCVFSGNSTDGDGGAICNSWSAPNITNCTFSNNSSTNVGGAIYNGGHTADNKHPKITNCILWNNTAPTNPEIGNSDSTPTVTYCDVQGGYSGTGNKNVDPMLSADLRIPANSPCIDAGSNSAPDILATDKDGNPRIIDGDRNGLATADMGAYESAGLTYQPHSGTINSETWGPGTHYVTATVTVNNNQVLTIQAGAVVKFAPTAGLTVNGTLRASGTGIGPANSVVFTSRDDDTIGEIIFGSDGSPAAGDWHGIYLVGNNYQGIGEFDYCVFRYGGNASGSADANVYFYFSDSGHMTNCISEHSAQHGVRISTCSPQIATSTFRYNGQSGLYASGAGTLTITGNTFSNNSQYGAYVNLTSVTPTVSGNTGSGNQTNAFVFDGNVTADQTWTSGPCFPILLLNTVTVNNNVRLTIAGGTVVKFAANRQLTVNGALDANGSNDNLIVFTSLKDDDDGCDTNGDGTATLPAAGDWYGIYLVGNNYQGIGEFDYCVFRYGGNASGLADANVHFYFSDSGYMANCISEHSAQHGVRISTCSPQIIDSGFRDNELSGLYTSGAGTPTITGNTFNNNSQYGAYVNLTSINPVISGNTGSGNLTNGFVFGGTVGANQTWTSTPGFPIVLLSAVTVNTNVRLTMEPGTVVKFAPGFQFTVNGTLDANGTEGDWVVFTSLKDDAYGGDTNGDGPATLPAAGDWYGIYLVGNTYQGIGEFDYCLFRYGGNASGSADANVYFYFSDSGHMTNCISEHSAQHGVRISNSSPLIANSTISKNTLGVSVASGSPRVINSIIWGNTSGGISGGTPAVSYSDIQGGFTGAGNINADPLFLNAAGGDYRLDECSPAVDAGDPVELLTADYVPGNIVVSIDQVTAVLPGSTVWINDGSNVEGDVVVSTSPTTITLTNGFTKTYTVAKRSYMFTSTSDFYGEPEPNGRRIDMGAYGGTSEASSPLSCRGDLHGGDADVDGSDLRAFITAFSTNNPAADLNNDGVVNAADLSVFAQEFGRTDCAGCP